MANFITNQIFIVLLLVFCVSAGLSAADKVQEPVNHRPVKDDDELRYWLGNMIWHHRFSDKEIAAATGMSKTQITDAKKRLDIHPGNRPKRPADAPLLALPYPGGRHPRIGFLEGAIRPQRETKISVFTPWDPTSYVVVDVPEAIWSNLGLTYLAHTHVPTLWTKRDITLEKLEWQRNKDGSFEMKRKLPNGIAYTAKVVPRKDHVSMEMTLTNGTDEALTDLRIQNCIMLKGALGFTAQTKDNKVIAKPYIAVRSDPANATDEGKEKTATVTGAALTAPTEQTRWIITAWDPCHRPWANKNCPCMHSDPKFPDCPPGKTQRIIGWLSFYQGKDVQAEFQRIEKTGWRKQQ